MEDISRFCHCSSSYISHVFNRCVKQNINEFINNLRIDEAKSYLANTSLPIKVIADRVGFNDPNYFSKVFKHITGTSPTMYRLQYSQNPSVEEEKLK